MATTKGQKLFSQFPAVTTEQWENVIIADLKGADYQKRLVWKTAEGFDVKPYYRAEDLAKIGHVATQIGQFPYVRGSKSGNDWFVHQTIEVAEPSEANAAAHRALAAGTESLGFYIPAKDFSASQLDALLKGIDITTTEVVFCGHSTRAIAQMIVERAKAEGMANDAPKCVFVIDPIINHLSLKGGWGCGGDGEKCFEAIKELIESGKQFKRLRFIGINGHQFHNSGSTIVQELAFTLAVANEYLVRMTDAGLPVDVVAPAIRFSMAVGSDYFMEMAKIRAARMLWANIVAPYNPSRGCSQKMRIHCVTSKWNTTIYDPYVNMLRGTTEAMSATLAGVHSLEVLPFNVDFEKPTEFSARIARNVQLLLKKESHFDQVADPAGGSYYIETLTDSIAQQAWNLFKEVEKRGGYIEAFKSGFIQESIEASASKRDMNLATRRQTLVGTNQYPNFNEKAPEVTLDNKGCTCCCEGKEAEYKALKPYRGAEPFEALRMSVDKSGKEPKAFMLTCGSLSMARARSQFACNFFACAGIKVVDNTFFASAEEGIKAALDAKAEIVVICASDDDYAVVAPQIAKAIGSQAIVVVAGAPACQAELEAEGIKNFISVKSNLLETLRGYVKLLGI